MCCKDAQGWTARARGFETSDRRTPRSKFIRRSGLNVIRLFGPEHGFFGAAAAGENVADTVYGGLPLISLYGSRRAPGLEHLRDLDALVFDVQDVGVRAYTYLSTLKACLSACAQTGVLLVVLERPNPLGRTVYGAGVTAGFESFVSAHNVPFVHGLTLGELAVLIARDLELEASLHVVKMVGYDGPPWGCNRAAVACAVAESAVSDKCSALPADGVFGGYPPSVKGAVPTRRSSNSAHPGWTGKPWPNA